MWPCRSCCGRYVAASQWTCTVHHQDPHYTNRGHFFKTIWGTVSFLCSTLLRRGSCELFYRSVYFLIHRSAETNVEWQYRPLWIVVHWYRTLIVWLSVVSLWLLWLSRLRKCFLIKYLTNSQEQLCLSLSAHPSSWHSFLVIPHRLALLLSPDIQLAFSVFASLRTLFCLSSDCVGPQPSS